MKNPGDSKKIDNVSQRQLILENQELSEVKLAMMNLLEDLERERSRIAEEKAKSDALLSSIKDGVIAIDNKGIIMYANDAAVQVLQIRNLVGRQCTMIPLFDADMNPVTQENRPSAMVLRSGAAMSFSRLFIGVSRVPVSLSIAPINRKGEVTGVVAVFRDIRKELEEQELKENFIALATHQLRSPLGSIRWYSEILCDEDVSVMDEEQKEFASRIQTGVTRMIETVDALLALSKIENGAALKSVKNVSIYEMIQDVLEVEKPGITRMGLTVSVKCPKKCPSFTSSESLVRQVVANVISNAVRYSKPKGKIAITISTQKKSLVFTVKDQGIGIPLTEMSQLGTKFFRASNAKKYVTAGSGLGLMLVKKVLQALNGSMQIQSELNKGTQVIVHIPHA